MKKATVNNHHHHLFLTLCYCLSFLFTNTFATVFVPSFNTSFESVPALFGKSWSTSDQVTAQLQFISEDPILCTEENDNNETSPMLLENYYNEPMALLIERGTCAFFEKAQIASSIDPMIEYVIIYDNEINQQLVPMSSSSESNTLDIGLLFVSFDTGMKLRSFMSNVTNHTILISMDGTAPLFPPPSSLMMSSELDMAGYLLAAMTGFFAFLVFFGCVLICAQAGWISAYPDENGRIILFATLSNNNNQRRRRRYRQHLRREHRSEQDDSDFDDDFIDLLTSDQVKQTLRQETYCSTTEKNSATISMSSSTSCAICLEEFEEAEQVAVLPCRHLFHQDCILPWLTERQSSCPLCKFDVLDHYYRHLEKGNDNNNNDKSVVDSEVAVGNSTNTAEEPNDNGTTSSVPATVPFWRRLLLGRQWTLIGNYDNEVMDGSESSMSVSVQDEEENDSNNNDSIVTAAVANAPTSTVNEVVFEEEPASP